MAPRNGITRAVLYLRRSTGRQEMSIEDQRFHCEKLARKEGYKIVDGYLDDAISGDKTESSSCVCEMMRAPASST